MRVRVAVGFFALVASASVAMAGDAVQPKHAWDFRVGSFVHKRFSSRTTMQGFEHVMENVEETKETLVTVTDTAFVVKTETRVRGAWAGGTEKAHPRELPKPKEKEASPGQVTKEKIEIEGTRYECTKDHRKTPSSTSTTWTHDKHGLLKSEYEWGEGERISFMVTALAKKVSAAGKDLTCRETKFVTKDRKRTPASPMGDLTTTVDLTSDAVPGHVVRSETTMSGRMRYTSVTELVALEVR